MIKDKWKRFAIGEVLSDHKAASDEMLFELMEKTETDDLDKLFDDYEVIVWQQFDNLELSDVACHITELAARAQEFEEIP